MQRINQVEGMRVLGIDKVLPFVKLFYGNKLNIAALTDFHRGQRRKLDDLYKSALLDQARIILATEIAGKDEADIEDFLPRSSSWISSTLPTTYRASRR